MDEHSKAMDAVRNDRIRFATMRPPGARSAVLERRVVVIGPPELVRLVGNGTKQDLQALIALLADPDRCWAAQVVLAAMTRREEKFVDALQATPEQWWPGMGARAFERWTRWFEQARDRLDWDPVELVFVERASR